MGLASSAVQPGGDASGDRGSLNHKRSRATHWIQNRLAWQPASRGQNAGGKHLRKRGRDLSHAPASLVERAACRVSKNSCGVSHQVQGQPQGGTPQLHAGPLSAGSAELVDHCILDDLRGVEGVRQKCVVDDGIDAERVGRLELLCPINFQHGSVE